MGKEIKAHNMSLKTGKKGKKKGISFHVLQAILAYSHHE